MAEPKIALVHFWLTNQGGAERVLWSLHKAFPNAPIYTSVFNAEKLPQFKQLDVRTSFLQNWPLAKTRHQLYPLLRRLAFESFDLSEYDIVISSCASEAKGVITSPGTLHVSYIHTPVRYYWSDYASYLKSPGLGMLNPLIRLLMPPMVSKMRLWDFAAAQRPDVLVANSENVRSRITKYYRRESVVINPPVYLERFKIDQPKKGFLVASRLVPYKKVDLAVQACKELGLPLTVVGRGSELARLKRLAGPNTKFVTRASDTEMAKYFESAEAFFFMAEEDFGIVPLEAMAAGTPVIAYGKGGALETVVEGRTGTLFAEQTVESVKEAIQNFRETNFDQAVLRQHASQFSEEVFVERIKKLVQKEYVAHKAKLQ